MIDLNEIKVQVKGVALCTDCLIRDDCIDNYPDVGCPAFRFLKRIAEEGVGEKEGGGR